jgi:Glycosyl hydrolase family 26
MKKALVLSIAIALGSIGCAASESTDDAGGTGGAAETGGTGGPSGSGGSADTGGTTGSGGVTGSGGATAGGGATGSGGVTASGGTTGSGGVTGSGGKVATGGTTGSGGVTGIGGAPASGGTTGTGGTTGSGGATGAAGNQGSAGKVGSGGVTGAGGTTGTGGATGTGGTTTTSPCSVSPVSPGASPQAQKLLCYLYSQYGNHVLSGQQEANWNANPTDISWYNTNIGKYPAIDGSDFLYTNGASCSSVTASTMRAIAYWNAGGLTMFRYHVGQPVAGSTCAQDCYSGTNCAESTPPSGLFTSVITAGTPENTAWNDRLDYVAVQIGAMKAANVPVILALFHETQSNGWFWWSIGDTGAQFIALYKYTFNYLTMTKGLNNIIWLMPYSGSPTGSFYPGASVVDIAGGDTYGTNQPFSSLYTTVKGIAGSTMPLALHETGLIPTPSAMFPTSAPWILFNIWAGYETSNNTVANIKSVYSDSHLITRDLIPNLK